MFRVTLQAKRITDLGQVSLSDWRDVMLFVVENY